jgi:hypothetical protein
MGMIITGIIGAVVAAVVAGYFLFAEGQDRPAWQVYSSSSARVGDPGQNLVGPGWIGDAQVGAAEEVAEAEQPRT